MGLEVDSGKLTEIAGQLRSGAESLEQVAGALPEAVDAGFSSDVANAALARVGKSALALSRQGELMASHINAARGAYEDFDQEVKDEVHLAEKDLERQQARRKGPLNDAPPEPPSEQTTTPGPTPTPPPAPN